MERRDSVECGDRRILGGGSESRRIQSGGEAIGYWEGRREVGCSGCVSDASNREGGRDRV